MAKDPFKTWTDSHECLLKSLYGELKADFPNWDMVFSDFCLEIWSNTGSSFVMPFVRRAPRISRRKNVD